MAKKQFGAAFGVLLLAAVATAVPVSGAWPGTVVKPTVQCGRASWYQLTSRTASGERANPNILAAAHRTLPFGTRVQVENLKNGRTVTVRINDRGPFVKGRVIDLTRAAAEALGFRAAGTTRVRIRVVGAAAPSGGC